MPGLEVMFETSKHIQILWTKGNHLDLFPFTVLMCIPLDAMSIRHYVQNDVPQLQQGTKLVKQGTLMQREVLFKLNKSGDAFEYGGLLLFQ